MYEAYPDLNVDFDAMSIRELAEFYNTHAHERDRVKTFRTRANALIRCEKLRQQVKDQRDFEQETENMSDEELTRYAFADLQPSREELARREARHERLSKNIPRSGNGSRKSMGITASWEDDDTHRRRTLRHRVTVEHSGHTEEYRSVREAFETLGLPMEPHVRFRGKLKREGERIFEHKKEQFIFRLVPRI